MSPKVKLKKVTGLRIADRYCIVDEIGKGGMGIVYQAMSFDDPSLYVAIKVIQRDGELSSDDLLRFQKEAALMSQLHHPNIISFLDLGLLDATREGSIGTGYYIVMEFAQGKNLKQAIQEDARKDLSFFFQIGLQVSEALSYTHGKNIIHRDIKPQNIIVTAPWKEGGSWNVKVLDFGVARLAEAMHHVGGDKDPARKDEFAGTPMYMAPEQTRLFDAPIDHRVDLYSLGCVLYETLAGRAPFNGNTRAKLEKQHVFSKPEPLTSLRPDLPPLVDQIIQKLLAKHPDERYQTAFSLHADLMRAKIKCESQANARNVTFPLGLTDRFQAVSALLPLAGRAQEFDSLIKAYQACAGEKGRSQMAVVRSDAGYGKTRLLAELKNHFTQTKVRFISGSFSRHENNLPFNALANAFNEYLLRIYHSQSVQFDELKQKVKQTLGPEGQWIARVVPGLKPYLSTSEVDSEEFKSPDEDFKRFTKAFSDFTRCLAFDGQPLVFMFDNLQWADDKSLELIDQFFSHNNSLRFYLVVAHRPIADIASRKIGTFLEKFAKLKRRFWEIDLTLLTRSSCRQIAESLLNAEGSVTDEFAAYLFKQSRGNPLFLVELVRNLVAQDYVFYQSSQQRWEYNVQDISQANISLQSLDLVLNSIQNYSAEFRSVLEVAAAAGQSFQKSALIKCGVAENLATAALERALADNLIIPSFATASAVEKEVAYTFIHPKAKEHIYDFIPDDRKRALHSALAKSMTTGGQLSDTLAIFSAAHHFNASLVDGVTEDRQIAEGVFIYNDLAGEEAWKAGAYQSAERYFENALSLCEKWPNFGRNREENVRLLENIADLAALQKRSGTAMKKYRDLLRMNLSATAYPKIANKAVYYQSINGIISDSIGLIQTALRRLRLPVPRGSRREHLQMIASLLIDILPLKFRWTRTFRTLFAAFSMPKSTWDSRDVKYPALNLYLSGTQLALTGKGKVALGYHHYAHREAVRLRGSPAGLIRAIAERGILLGYLGARKIGYRIVDLAIQTTRSLRMESLEGYLTLMRIVYLDYSRPRQEEIALALGSALSKISEEHMRVAYGLGIVFDMFRDLQRGAVPHLMETAKRIPGALPTRNWLSARAHAILLFGLFLTGSRDDLVRRGQQFLLRRQEVGAREKDLFVYIIRAMVAFAKGETSQAQDSFYRVLKYFAGRLGAEFLLPFEEDFVTLFCLAFPAIVNAEAKVEMVPRERAQGVYRMLLKRVSGFSSRGRAIPLLAAARLRELRGQKNVGVFYDRALQLGKMNGEFLALLFGYIWIGEYLYSSKTSRRRNHVIHAQRLAEEKGLSAIAQVCAKLLGPKEKRDDAAAKTSPSGFSVNPLVNDHLACVVDAIDNEAALSVALEQSFGRLRRLVKYDREFVVLGDDGAVAHSFLYPQAASSPGLIDYIKPYMKVTSTLFVPLSDAPWLTPSDVPRSMQGTLVRSGTEATPPPMSDLEKTNFIQESPSPEAKGSTQMRASETPAARATFSMGALIPLRTEDGNIGIVFLEGVQIENIDSSQLRQDLDQFCTQLSILIHCKNPREVSQILTAARGSDLLAKQMLHKTAKFEVQPTPWLQTLQHGKLRTSRETSWYLGLPFGAQQYSLFFLQLIGDTSDTQKLGAQIWYQLWSYRLLSQAAGRDRLDAGEIRDELLHVLKSSGKASTLQSISLSFSLFDKQMMHVTSGHFGPARPHVLGQDNQIVPFNEPVLNLAEGKDLRYWDVEASLMGAHLYVLTRDSNRLEADNSASLMRRIRSLTNEQSTFKILIEKMNATDLMPRYYVAIFYPEAAKAKGESVSTQKAS